jgi:hypothetical protein
LGSTLQPAAVPQGSVDAAPQNLTISVSIVSS